MSLMIKVVTNYLQLKTICFSFFNNNCYAGNIILSLRPKVKPSQYKLKFEKKLVRTKKILLKQVINNRSCHYVDNTEIVNYLFKFLTETNSIINV